jgi:hypothetical protein
MHRLLILLIHPDYIHHTQQQVTKIHEKGVGMTAGYFSSIKKVECVFSGMYCGVLWRHFIVHL